MVRFLGTISLLPKSNSTLLENNLFSNASFFATKLPKQLFEEHLVLNSSVKLFNIGYAFGEN